MTSIKSSLLVLLSIGVSIFAELPNETPTKALFVVGTLELHADAIYKERLERQGYTVSLILDKDVTESHCESHDIMLISASISGGAVGKKLNACSTPQMIWESRLYSLNGMTANVVEAQRVTSRFFHENHETSFEKDGVPPLPTGAKIEITKDAEGSGLVYVDAGAVDFWTVEHYGMNYIGESQLGKGAKVVAILPPENTAAFPVKPQEKKATFFYYEQGAELYGDTGASPAFRIGWPVFGFNYGACPSCEEVKGVDCVDDSCQKNCRTKQEIIESGVNPMPLSCQGVNFLDYAISKLTQEARKRSPHGKPPHQQQKPSKQQQQQDLSLEAVQGHNKDGDYWVVVEGYVVDISKFLPHHPGSRKEPKIKNAVEAGGPDVTIPWKLHSRATKDTFDNAAKEFEKSQQPVSFTFTNVTGAVTILGKLQ